MSFFGVTIEKIECVWKHPNADRLDICRLKDKKFNFVIERNLWTSGDRCLYFPVDSLLPDELMAELGVATITEGGSIADKKLCGPYKNRIKTLKIRGEISQGMIGPISLIEPSIGDEKNAGKQGLFPQDQTSEKITEYLGVTKYEPPIIFDANADLVPLPEGLSVYDIEGADRYTTVAEVLMDRWVVISEKVEGCVSGDTLVETLLNGTIPIKEVAVGIMVKSFSIDTGEIEYCEVLESQVKDNNGDWFEVELENGAIIRITGDHRIWMPDKRCWRKAKDIEEGDEIIFELDRKD